jgi:hypothetical protein
MCTEQMMAGAIGFRGRGEHRSIGTPFDVASEACRLCGGCMYVCPACQLRCTYNEPEKAICGACANLSAPCLEKPKFDDLMCYMAPCVVFEIRKDRAPQRRDVAFESEFFGRHTHEEPDGRVRGARIRHVRDLRGRLHRDV